jgi:hypothetical protein
LLPAVHGIRRKRNGYAVGLHEHERRLLRETSAELEALLAGGQAPPRLFPAAYRDDDEAAAEYERLVRPSLEEGKIAALRTLAATAGDSLLDEATAQTWLAALNDLRLALGARLDVREDDGVGRLVEPGYAVYAWLTWLQSELVDALMRG